MRQDNRLEQMLALRQLQGDPLQSLAGLVGIVSALERNELAKIDSQRGGQLLDSNLAVNQEQIASSQARTKMGQEEVASRGKYYDAEAKQGELGGLANVLQMIGMYQQNTELRPSPLSDIIMNMAEQLLGIERPMPLPMGPPPGPFDRNRVGTMQAQDVIR